MMNIKKKLRPFIQIDNKCPYHPKNIINLFCVEEKSKIKLFNIYKRTLLCILYL
mgnify:CR=1 FL=1